jgi:hypothetical protein
MHIRVSGSAIPGRLKPSEWAIDFFESRGRPLGTRGVLFSNPDSSLGRAWAIVCFQLTFDTFTVGRFLSFTSEGCPDGYMTIDEENRPATGGQWCGSAWGYTVYYSETRSINLTLYLSRLSGQVRVPGLDSSLPLSPSLSLSRALAGIRPTSRTRPGTRFAGVAAQLRLKPSTALCHSLRVALCCLLPRALPLLHPPVFAEKSGC